MGSKTYYTSVAHLLQHIRFLVYYKVNIFATNRQSTQSNAFKGNPLSLVTFVSKI